MTDCILNQLKMSSTTNSDQTQEQRNDDMFNLPSPCKDEIECFGNESSCPDLDLVVKGMEKPLRLHRVFIRKSSGKLRQMIENNEKTVEWKYDTKKAVDREALVKGLRFCYGETQVVGTENGECCALIAALIRLQVTCMEEAVTALSNFAIEKARQDVLSGAKLLLACTEYDECNSGQCTLGQDLAKIVLTKENMSQHFREVVDECLMRLPQEYLTLVEYSEPHSKCSEFRLGVRYIRNHDEMPTEKKEEIVGQCDWSTLNSDELRELRLLDIIDKDKLLEAYEKALSYCEIECEQANKRAKNAETDKDKQVKQVEHERDEKVQQACKEKEEYQRQLETMQALIRGNRLLLPYH